MIREMFLAVLVNDCGTWMSWYLNWREFGHRSMFGESCISDMTEAQSRLVSMTHLYDVIQSDFNLEVEVPKRLKPYPHQLSKWYDDTKKKLKEKRENEKLEAEREAHRNKQGKGKRSDKGNYPGRPQRVYNESDAEAYSVMMKARRDREKAKNTVK